MTYDMDIQKNPYLSESGRFACQFARNHNMPVEKVYEHPTYLAYLKVMSSGVLEDKQVTHKAI